MTTTLQEKEIQGIDVMKNEEQIFQHNIPKMTTSEILDSLSNPLSLEEWFTELENIAPNIAKYPGYMKHVPLSAIVFAKWAKRFQKIARKQISKYGKLEFTDFDTETTGLDSPRKFLEGFAGVTDVAGIRISGVSYLGNELTRNGVQSLHPNRNEFQSLSNPGVKIPRSVQEITHITDQMVSAAPLQYTALREFKRFSKDTILLGHNIGDDFQNKNGYDLYNVLEPIFERYFNQKSGSMREIAVDTKPMFTGLVAGVPHTNTVLANLFGIKLVGAHRAMPDVRVHAIAFSMLLPLLLSLDADSLEKDAEEKLDKKNFYLTFLRPGAIVDDTGYQHNWIEFGIKMDKQYNYGRRRSSAIIKYDLDKNDFIYEDLELKDGRIIPASEVETNMPAHVMRRQAMIFKKTMNFEDSISNLVVEF